MNFPIISLYLPHVKPCSIIISADGKIGESELKLETFRKCITQVKHVVEFILQKSLLYFLEKTATFHYYNQVQKGM